MPGNIVFTSDPAADHLTRITLDGTALAVRVGLAGLLSSSGLAARPEADRGQAEIVLAEVLNNIVEHAYANVPGRIELTLRVAATGLSCHIVDFGAALPDGALPPGDLPDLEACEELPEGGFGWHLIRELTRDLQYRRIGDSNHLRFEMDLAAQC